jgi:WD40 repeat protein
LLRGSRLEQFESWSDTATVALTPDESALLTVSSENRRQRQAQEEERHKRELETAQKLAEEQRQRAEEQGFAADHLRRRAYLLTSAMVIAILLALTAIVFGQSAVTSANVAATAEIEALNAKATSDINASIAATREVEAVEQADLAQVNADLAATREVEANLQRNVAEVEAEQRAIAQADAEQAAKIAVSRELASAAQANLDLDPERSILLALHGLSTEFTAEAEIALHQAIQRSRLRGASNLGEPLYWASLSPNGRQLFTSGEGGGSLWDIETRELLFRKDVPGFDWLNQAAFTPDGSLLIIPGEAWGEDGPAPSSITIVDVQTGEELVEYSAHDAWIQEVTVSQDGTLFATISGDQTVKIWDLAGTLANGTGQLVHRFEANDWGSFVRFSPDGTRLAASLQTDQLQIWDVASGDRVMTLDAGEGYQPSGFDYTSDGKYIVNGTSAGPGRYSQIQVWDTSSGELISTVRVQIANAISDIVLSQDGTLLASFSRNMEVKVWQFEPQELQEIVNLPGLSVRNSFFSNDNQELTTVTENGAIKRWDISESGQSELATIAGPAEVDRFVRSAHFIDEGKRLITAGDEGLLYIWDTATWDELMTVQAHNDRIRRIDYSPDEHLLATGIDNEDVALAQIWDTETWQLKHTLEGHDPVPGFFNGVLDVKFNMNGKLVATAGADGKVIVWDSSTGNLILKLDGHNGNGVLRVEFSPNDRFLASTGGGLINIWDVSDGQLLSTLSSDGGAWSLDFSPDSKQLLAGNEAGTVFLWLLPDNLGESSDAEVALQYSIQTDVGWFTDARFDADGQKIALVGGTGLTEIRDTSSGALIMSLTGPSRMSEVHFAPDGYGLATVGTDDGVLRIYVLSPYELIQLAKSRVTRTLTEGECNQFLHIESCPAQ